MAEVDSAIDKVRFGLNCSSYLVDVVSQRIDGHSRMRIPSFNCVVTCRTWLLAAFPGRTKGLLCAATMVTLLNFLLQNCVWPLHGCVFVGCAEDGVKVVLCKAVPFVEVEDKACPPVRYVTEADVLEFDPATEPKIPLTVALVAVEVDSTLLVES